VTAAGDAAGSALVLTARCTTLLLGVLGVVVVVIGCDRVAVELTGTAAALTAPSAPEPLYTDGVRAVVTGVLLPIAGVLTVRLGSLYRQITQHNTHHEVRTLLLRLA
jgi:hypothetical protein